MATALFIDCSINRYFSAEVPRKNYIFKIYRKDFFNRRKSLTFPKINLKGQQVGLNLVAHQVLQGDQELHCLLQRILRLK